MTTISKDFQKYFVETFSTKDYYQRCRDLAWRYEFYLRNIHETLESGKFEGTKCVEIGCGPTIFSLASASRHFDKLVSSDYAEDNREEVQKWLSEDPSAIDFSPHLEYVAKLEGYRDLVEGRKAIEARIRSKLKSVVFADVLHEEPLPTEVNQEYDLIISSLCLESACPDIESTKDALRNMSSLLRKGGGLFLMGVVGAEFYKTGKTLYSCLPLTRRDLETSLQAAGYCAQDWQEFQRPKGQQRNEEFYDSVYFLTALKL